MKVLFAINNDDISNAIVKKYQKEYKEILSYKNVYYFNAILKELQKDKTYDRVVISEDLEPFANSNYDAIDKFLFEKLDNISDEATNEDGKDTDIILICTDRRNKTDDMLVKLFGIGIYNAIIGQDRSIMEVCRLINRPRTKKEAKLYYKIEVESVNYKTENENSVSEEEVQNILAHYRKIGKDEDKYVESFNNIASQYNDTQLKIIVRYLPIGVKAVLEEKSAKYQTLVGNEYVEDNENKQRDYNNYKGKEKNKKPYVSSMLNSESKKQKLKEPIIVPSGLNKAKVKKVIGNGLNSEESEKRRLQNIQDLGIEENDDLKANNPLEEAFKNEDFTIDFDDEEETNQIPGLDELDQLPGLEGLEGLDELDETSDSQEPKRGRGRPKKIVDEAEQQEDKPKRGRGRPKKNANTEENSNDDLDLFDLDNVSVENDADIDLFNLDTEDEKEDEQENEIPFEDENEDNQNDDNDIDLFGLDDSSDNSFEEQTDENNQIAQTDYKAPSNDFSSLITKDKKIVSFVGTTKNGTSFIVNNVAHLLASRGIKTAILDLTKTRNAYYIYTNSEEKLMEKAKSCIQKLKNGIADGIEVNNNLSIYTSIPEDDADYSRADILLETLIKNYSAVLIDCDFDTPMEYFDASQEIYLVQSMDVLTMQPLTAFLRNLQSKGILKQEKLKAVINKGVKIKSVSVKTLIGGISKYNDPSMTYMKDLFDKDKISYCVIPFELPNYIKYLDSVITCKITLAGYTKPFITALNELGNMVYPVINKQVYSAMGPKSTSFSNEMTDTLNKMKSKYQ